MPYDDGGVGSDNYRGGKWYLKKRGLGKFWQDLKISEAFLISLEVSFFMVCFYFFWVSKLFTKESRARISN